MTQPATGATFKNTGLGTVDNRFYSRGPLVAVLIRDNLGSTTDISPQTTGGAVGFSPFAQDGELRDDLLAWELVDGDWVANATTNEGWYRIGAMEERGGPQRTNDIRQDDAMILQSLWPFQTDITSQSKTLEFTAVEFLNPLMVRLRMNLPLTDTSGNSLVEFPGTADYAQSQPVDAEPVDRQILAIYAKKISGQYLYHVEGYPLAHLTDIGNYRRSKTDADAPSLSYRMLPDPYHVGLNPNELNSTTLIPGLYSEWIGGPAWAAMNVASGSAA